jgi:hypothetical protein
MISTRPGAAFSPTGVLTLATGGTGQMIGVAREVLQGLSQ